MNHGMIQESVRDQFVGYQVDGAIKARAGSRRRWRNQNPLRSSHSKTFVFIPASG
jgi:hypothetical protein